MHICTYFHMVDCPLVVNPILSMFYTVVYLNSCPKKKKSCMHYKVRTKFGVDDAENKVTSELHDTHTLEIAPAQHKREDLAESIGVVPAKYPPKVKLELLTTLEC